MLHTSNPLAAPLVRARRKRALIILGTRPEAIKLAPVVRAMAASGSFEPVVVSTGQHREMLQPMLDLLRLEADVDLAVMRPRQHLSDLTARLIEGLGHIVRSSRPELVVVQGDTTSAMVGGLAAAYEKIPVAHVEAGLRTHDLDNPFPEELNRQVIGRLARWHFAPTAQAASNLYDERIAPDRIYVTGNTSIDNQQWILREGIGTSAFRLRRRGVLVTMHRRENQGEPMRRMAATLRQLADRGDIEIVLPLHKSPAVREALLPELLDHPAITVVEALEYSDFMATLATCHLVLTDSGGVQEEAPSLGKPVLVLRTTTERSEAVEAGVAKLIGTDPTAILSTVTELLDDPVAYAAMANPASPFGDGRAAPRILQVLSRENAHTVMAF